MPKQSLTEQETCSLFIIPALEAAGWDLYSQVRAEVRLTQGRVLVGGGPVRRGGDLRADYVLCYRPNVPVAVIEAKRSGRSAALGIQQALRYAELLEVPFVFSSSGESFVFHDRTGLAAAMETELSLDEFPSPDELWARYCAWKGLEGEGARLVLQPYHAEAGGKALRYYQVAAVTRALRAIGRGQRRVLLVMATGTGKTYTAFQIIWKLWKSRARKRILFLVDRDALATQTRNKDFAPFGRAMTRIENRKVEPQYEIFVALYQSVTGAGGRADLYRDFSPDFFDLVVIDECHRGSAAEDSAWREVLDYFGSATHLGLTATPKETAEVSNHDYFGEPVYTYSLRQGIEDGFLAPYKVIRIDLDKDLTGWRPEAGQTDKHGTAISDRVYGQTDFDRTLVLEQRTRLVARKVTEYLKATDRYAKTIVFCENVNHAERMRQALVNENADLVAEDRRYVMRITGDEREGKAELENFANPEERYPVIATTSELMTTGIDAPTCRVLVLDQRIQSITKFKQVIGRGTRISEEHGKYWFTILDFKRVTELFADPAFDGDPVVIYEPGPGDAPVPPDTDQDQDAEQEYGDEAFTGTTGRYVVSDVAVTVVAERVQYYGPGGSLITESLREHTRRRVRESFASDGHFQRVWLDAPSKGGILRDLEARGVLLHALGDELGHEFDLFDLIRHVTFDQPPRTRSARAERVRTSGALSGFGPRERLVLEALLDKYAAEGVESLEQIDVLRVQPFTALGTVVEIIHVFGGTENYLAAVRKLEEFLYAPAA
ncbi:EcoAI/FtnUII family type I restriction enzme subunit R [Longimicrobium terrae]|uniref:Type I restriction enzyme R subunit n=1 Tax=Longimicrobium terrae TaxID=1639882 RepID=A0A841GYS4_9BACT|nr:DEAD/DEAH box helicase family protein [Longimicrobium terrae]MBB4636566.1 type I restriction enzyme R subunit [Longimicrobium terrae]MBB6070910.1 type I restriction enzyme R subunit [Longimicrobium terrae]NNC28933.1 DEAD/DEAH box helicase family protein [Longimicrobium terrae]